MPFDRWLFTVDRAVGQSRSLAIAPISRGRFVGYSPSEKASSHSAGVDAGNTVPHQRLVTSNEVTERPPTPAPGGGLLPRIRDFGPVLRKVQLRERVQGCRSQ